MGTSGIWKHWKVSNTIRLSFRTSKDMILNVSIKNSFSFIGGLWLRVYSPHRRKVRVFNMFIRVENTHANIMWPQILSRLHFPEFKVSFYFIRLIIISFYLDFYLDYVKIGLNSSLTILINLVIYMKR